MNGLTKWIALALSLIVVVGGSLYAYGRLAGNVADHERRIGRAEAAQAEILETVQAIDKRTVRLEERQGAMMRTLEELKEK